MIKKAAVFMLSAILAAGTIFSGTHTVHAAQKISVSESEYNLVVEDYPSFTSEWDSVLAKMNNTKKTDDYVLSLFDDWTSTEAVMEAFEAAGKKVNMDNVIAMDVVLYKMESDEEYYPVDGSIDVTVICPIPDFYYDSADKVQLYNLSSSGKFGTAAFTLVSVNDITCVKFTAKENSNYAFVLTDSVVVPSKEQNTTATATPVPTKKPEATKTPQSSTPTPTKAPTTVLPTPEPKPQSSGTQNSTSSVQNNSGSNSTASNNTSSGQRPLDKTPQTGDTATTGLWVGGILLSGTGIAAAIWWLKKK